MKRIILAVILLASTTKSLTYWKEIGNGSPAVISMTLSGPNEGYVVQGAGSNYGVYQMDWGSGSSITTSMKSISYGVSLSLVTGVQSDSGFNVLASSNSILRFNAQPGAGTDFEEYSVPKTGALYASPFWAAQTNYMFVSAKSFSNAADLKLYRLHSDRVTDIKIFSTGANSRSYGVLYGTSWLVVSLSGTGRRNLYDYTNGYEGGTNTVVQSHSRQALLDEVGFISPEDGRGVYVVAIDDWQTVQKIFTVKNDGTDLLHHDLSATFTYEIMFPKWIKDTDLCVVPSWGEDFAIVNFMDTNKPAPTYYTVQGSGSDIWQPQVWKYYKVLLISSSGNDRSYVYKALAEMPCADLCGTCDGIFRKKCLTCVPHSTKSGTICSCDDGYFSKNISPYREECLACSPLCGTCSGGATTQCLVCRYSYMEKKGDGSCGCPEGKYLSGTNCLDCEASCKTCSGGSSNECLSCDLSTNRYLSSNSCPVCHSSCRTCSGPTSSDCLSCAVLGYFLDSGTCQSCSSKDSALCPKSIKITLPNRYEELTQNLIIILTPSLQDSQIPSEKLSVDSLIDKHISFKFKRIEENGRPLTILEKKLNHEKNQSQLFVKFLEKMRSSNTEHISLLVTDPWLYRAPEGEANQKVIYLKEQEYRIKVERKEEIEEEENLEQSAKTAKITRAAIGVAATFSIFSAIFSGAGGSAFNLIGFFNILEVISNLSKLNVTFAPNIIIIAEFIENLKIPEFKILAQLSPLKDNEFDDPDVNAYQLIPRGTRAKITTSNREVFMASGQNFIISLTIIALWVVLSLLELCLKKGSRILGFIAFVYQMMIGVGFFDYHFICISEISLLSPTALGQSSPKFTFSLFLSIFFYLLIIENFYHGYQMIRVQAFNIISKNKTLGELDISKNDRLILEKYTGGLQKDSYGSHTYLALLENMRFFVIQLIIVCLQLLNRAQALLVLLVNLGYFIHFLRLISTRKVFNSKPLLIKMIVQECCIMVFILTITLFSFTESTSFSSSTFYKVIEVFAMLSIVGTAGSEFLVMAKKLILELSGCCRKKKASKNKENRGLNQVAPEGFDTRPRRSGDSH